MRPNKSKLSDLVTVEIIPVLSTEAQHSIEEFKEWVIWMFDPNIAPDFAPDVPLL